MEKLEKLEKMLGDLILSQQNDREDMRELRESQRAFSKRQEKTDEQIREMSREIRESQRKTDEQFRKTDEQLRKTDAKLDRMSKRLGEMGVVSGEVVEEYFHTSLRENPMLGEIRFDEVRQSVRPVGLHGPEFDLLLLNGDSVGIIEVKKKAHHEQLHELTLKQTKGFRETCPNYSGHKLYFGIASMVTSPALIERAKEAGFSS